MMLSQTVAKAILYFYPSCMMHWEVRSVSSSASGEQPGIDRSIVTRVGMVRNLREICKNGHSNPDKLWKGSGEREDEGGCRGSNFVVS
jgi:hypothetical protein